MDRAVTSDRWNRLEQLFHAALERPPQERSAYLDAACAGDGELRADVEALLARNKAAPDFLGVPAVDLAARGLIANTSALFAAGQRIGPYEVIAAIGFGGMGEVYRARDTRLGRDVAIKVLSPLLSSEMQWTARFEREARVLAALNHPNIAAIYGLEEIAVAGRSPGPIRALILELVEGPTLAEAIRNPALLVDGDRGTAAASPRGLPVGACVAIGRQIVDALDRAHQAGIVHRDLKPANIKVARDHTVKVLDFGLAKLVIESPGTVQSTLLPAGMLLGTPAYMSPEQARGGSIDKRADIWAFGCVLFEMLSGRPPFLRNTGSDTIVQILTAEPEWESLGQDIPQSLTALLERCLVKNAHDRLRDIADARPYLAETPQTRTPHRGTSARPRNRRWVAAAVVVGILAGGAAWIVSRVSRPPRPGPQLLEFRVDVPPTHTPWSGVALSPDGRSLAIGTFGNGPSIWIHNLESGQSRSLPGTENSAYPFWSPDGQSIGFFSVGKLRRMDVAGGPAVDLANTRRARGGSWSADGEIIFSDEGALYRLSAPGGTPSRLDLTTGTEQPLRHLYPRFLPDGRSFLFFAQGPPSGVYLASVDSRDAALLVEADEPAEYAAPGYVLFIRGNSLMAQRLNLTTRRLEAVAQVVASDVAPGYLDARASFAVSESGVLSYVSSRAGSPGRLTWFERGGRALASIDQPADVEYLNPAISPHGDRVAVNRMDAATGNWDVWIADIERGTATRATSNPARDSDAVWSPDGRRIVFFSNRGGRAALYTTLVDRSAADEMLMQVDYPDAVLVPSDWSSDGRFVVYSQSRAAPGGWSIGIVPVTGDRIPFPLQSKLSGNHHAGRISPDGKWIAYTSLETGTSEVFVEPLLAGGPRSMVSRNGGTHPRWRDDGRELIYWAVPGGIATVDTNLARSPLGLGVPKILISSRVHELIDGRPHYDVTRDGHRFLLRQPADARRSPIGVIVNWTQKLQR
jgi:serine/threonine protein kinase